MAVPTGLLGSMTPGVLELDTSNAAGGATYPMNVTYRPLVDTFRASSDFDGKLVTSRPGPAQRLSPVPSGTFKVSTNAPSGRS